jgi:hypothetical protein
MSQKLIYYRFAYFALLALLIALTTYDVFTINFKADTSDFYIGKLNGSLIFAIFIIYHVLRLRTKNALEKTMAYLEKYFTYAKYVFMVLVFVGVLLIAFNPSLNLWKGIGATCFLYASLLLFLDFYGASILKSR